MPEPRRKYKNKSPYKAMRAIFRSRQRIANKATLTMEKQKRATIAVALSISSYSERQKRANSKKNTDE